MRILFILTDSKYMYGASKSLKGLLDGLDDSFEYDVIMGGSFTQNSDKDAVRNNFGGRMNNLHYCWVPRYRCNDYTNNGLISELSHFVNNCMALLFRFRIMGIIRRGHYDYIHLNSTLLYPLIEKRHDYIIHNRDIIKECYWLKGLLRRKLSAAKGMINIDKTTEVAAESIGAHVKNSVTLANPIDMTSVAKYDPIECAGIVGISAEHKEVIFAMVGQISEEKGAAFALEGFHKSNIDNAVLLVVGNDKTEYAKKLVKKYSDDRRIVFTGEFADIFPVYRVADCIVRGEDKFAVGRTHREGLFSGTSILIPGKKENIADIYHGEEYKDRVVFYTPRDIEDFGEKLRTVGKIDWNDRRFVSNAEEYSKLYREFVETLERTR